MKLITNAFNGTQIFDDNGTVVVYLKNTYGSGRIECDPKAFRDNTMRSDTIGGQHVEAVEKYYNITY